LYNLTQNFRADQVSAAYFSCREYALTVTEVNNKCKHLRLFITFTSMSNSRWAS